MPTGYLPCNQIFYCDVSNLSLEEFDETSLPFGYDLFGAEQCDQAERSFSRREFISSWVGEGRSQSIRVPSSTIGYYNRLINPALVPDITVVKNYKLLPEHY